MHRCGDVQIKDNYSTYLGQCQSQSNQRDAQHPDADCHTPVHPDGLDDALFAIPEPLGAQDPCMTMYEAVC
jgi:hypothetical protein